MRDGELRAPAARALALLTPGGSGRTPASPLEEEDLPRLLVPRLAAPA